MFLVAAIYNIFFYLCNYVSYVFRLYHVAIVHWMLTWHFLCDNSLSCGNFNYPNFIHVSRFNV